MDRRAGGRAGGQAGRWAGGRVGRPVCMCDCVCDYVCICPWCILKYTYHLPEKLLTIICALHEDCNAAVRAYGKTSKMFSVTSGIRQGCVLAPTLFNFYFDTAIHMALNVHRQEERGIKVAYLLDADLMGKRER